MLIKPSTKHLYSINPCSITYLDNANNKLKLIVSRAKAHYDKARHLTLCRKWFKIAARRGSTEGMFLLACMLKRGEGGEENKALARDYYRQAASAIDQRKLLTYFLNREVKSPFLQDIKIMNELDNGHVGAMYFYAQMLERGIGGDVDKPLARYWYARAANTGDIYAMYDYALMLFQGMGGEVDYELAFFYFEEASLQEHPLAMHHYACMLENGWGGKESKPLARKFYKKAAEAGFQEAMYDFARVLEWGIGGEIDFALACFWYCKAAKGGFSAAIARLYFLNLAFREY